ADLSLVATSETEVHIAYNEENGLIYAVNKDDGSYRTLDPATGTFGPLTMIDADVDEIIGAVISSNGKLLISSQTSNVIYSVNLTSNEVSVFDSFSPILGGDIAFGQDGMLYLATRLGFGTLFEAYPDEVLADQFLSDISSLVTGLAVANNGQLLLSSRESSVIDVRNTDGSNGTPFNLMLDGESFESFNGDMASGCADNVPDEDDCNYALYYTHRPAGGSYTLLSVELNGGVANTTELLAVGNSAHIGLSPDGAFIYILGGQNVETYDVALGTIVNSVNVETAGGQNLSNFPAAVVAADGTLYGASGNKIYSIDPATGIAEQFGPNRNVNGGDLIEVAGELWIITR
ncbi:MAG: hypothetical protein LC687_01825, partial [Actinobacteria bacterium]|nr:hypothetical protein [Actinomycetota bacterium]